MRDAHQVVVDYWDAAANRDWATFADLPSDQVVHQAPQTRERVCGRMDYVRFNAEGFPGDWHLKVERVVAETRRAAS
jgi:predicted ester cyclase